MSDAAFEMVGIIDSARTRRHCSSCRARADNNLLIESVCSEESDGAGVRSWVSRCSNLSARLLMAEPHNNLAHTLQPDASQGHTTSTCSLQKAALTLLRSLRRICCARQKCVARQLAQAPHWPFLPLQMGGSTAISQLRQMGGVVVPTTACASCTC